MAGRPLDWNRRRGHFSSKLIVADREELGSTLGRCPLDIHRYQRTAGLVTQASVRIRYLGALRRTARLDVHHRAEATDEHVNMGWEDGPEEQLHQSRRANQS